MSLREWYAKRDVLLTGVTSELGRALLEKLLRSFPDIFVYVLIRSRGGLSKDDRVKKIFATSGYERLRTEQPNAISRVKALEGNLLYEGLGMSTEDRALLRGVSVVFHAGGPHDDVFDFCQDLTNLRVLAAASNVFTHKGQIAETLQNEKVPNLPLAMVRITMLGPAYQEPMPGFVEILKGPTALMVGAGLVLGSPEFPAEVIPVDIAVNTLIAAAWEKGSGNAEKGQVVYNAPTIGCTWGDLIKKGRKGHKKFAYPSFGVPGMISSAYLYWLIVFLFEWLPSFLCDSIIGICGGKRRILAEYERVRNVLKSVESISSRSWPAERNRVKRLHDKFTPEERIAFAVLPEIDIESYVLCASAATKKYCVNEDNLKIIGTFRYMFLMASILGLTYAIFLSVQLRVN